jgi:serine/threonine-protein kinase
MAEVWLARPIGAEGRGGLVAIKTILPKFADDDGFQRMFLDEANVSSNIEHPNVARVFDVGEQDDVTYLVMEYVDGDALSTLHREARNHGVSIPQGVVLRLMAEVCGGLHVAHELRLTDGRSAGVVHRDVSPHNVLVTVDGTAKLIDFGLAKAVGRLAQETSAGIVKGKLRYMAPEQIVGPTVDRRADVWAVGASLYHLLSGAPPYEAEADVDVFRLLMSGDPPRRLDGIVHPAVEAVVLRSLERQPERRFATALDFQRAIQQAARQARLEASSAQVADFLALHLRDRAEHRRALLPVAPIPVAPAPPSSGARSPVTRNLATEPNPSPGRGARGLTESLTTTLRTRPAEAAFLVAAAVAGLAVAFWLTPATGSAPVSAAAVPPGPVAHVASTSSASARARAAGPVVAPAPPSSPSRGTDDSISMTVSVMDLPVAAPTTRPRVAAPVARLAQVAAPATTPAETAGTTLNAKDAGATDDPDDDAGSRE